MMIKVSNEFLDFNEQIEVEKQIKLFEDISTTDGDFSYAFDLPKTINNTRILQNPFPDNINKPVYQQILAKLLSDSGAELYDGYLRIEKVTDVYQCSFFAGNNNWFAMISGLLSDLDLSRFDLEQTISNIQNSWLQTDGVVFPLVDNGALLTRSDHRVKIEDFIGALYVKIIFNQIFIDSGIKIQGELLNDWMFNNTVFLKNSKNQEGIDDRTSFVEKNATQVLPFQSLQKVTWDNDSVLPYFDGANNNFDLANSQYVADLKSIVRVDVTTVYIGTGFGGGTELYILVNGTVVTGRGGGAPAGVETTTSVNANISLNAGDILEIWQHQTNVDGDAGTLLRGNLKITPTYLYKVFGKSLVPNWTKQQFISNILRLFNVLASYNAGNATLTLNLFEKIKSKPAVDLSEYISETEVDYSEFISDYGKRSKFSYNEVDFDELKDANVGKFFKYGQGVINVNNDFIEDDVDVIESDFSNPIAYKNETFDMSIEKTNLLEIDEGESVDITSVANDVGNAKFMIPGDIFIAGDLVRISDATNPSYDGDWVVLAVGSGYFYVSGLTFDTNATATATKMDYVYGNSDDVFLLVNIPNYQVLKFSGDEYFFFEDNITYSLAVGYFDLINTNRQINIDFIYSLSFGGIDDPLHYMVTMIEQYFRLFRQVLNDPVKLYSVAHLPYSLFVQIDFLSPIKIRTIESTNMYYLNRITGYKESYLDCQIEIIKI